MLFFVDRAGHDLEVPFFRDLVYEVLVYVQISERCAVYIEPSGSGAGEVVVV